MRDQPVICPSGLDCIELSQRRSVTVKQRRVKRPHVLDELGWVVSDALASLQGSVSRGQRADRVRRGAAKLLLSLEHSHRGSALGGRYGGGQAGATATHHHDVVGVGMSHKISSR